MARYESIADAFEYLGSNCTGWEHREERAREMASILDQFGSDAVAEYLIEASGHCPVCNTRINGKHIREFSEPKDGMASIPHVICPNACLDPLDHMRTNKWRPLTGEWKVTDLEQRAARMVGNYIHDHVEDLKNVYTSGEQAELALSQAEQAAIHNRLDEVLAIAEGDIDITGPESE